MILDVMVFKIFFKLPFKEKLLLTEAFVCLLAARLAILVFPFKKIAPGIGIHMKETPPDIHPRLKEILLQIRRSIRRASKYAPWQSKCLVQAIAGKMMLKRRNIPYTLYLGVTRDVGKEVEKKNALKAHAWLRSGNIILAGKEGFKKYTVVSTFGEEGRNGGREEDK